MALGPANQSPEMAIDCFFAVKSLASTSSIFWLVDQIKYACGLLPLLAIQFSSLDRLIGFLLLGSDDIRKGLVFGNIFTEASDAALPFVMVFWQYSPDYFSCPTADY